MPIDFFVDSGRRNSDLHPQFATLRDVVGYAPARAMLRELQTLFVDPDGNFVEQFQTTGFDSRTFELFLFAMLRDAGHCIDRSEDRPDFMIKKGEIVAAVEAVTANPPPQKGIQPYSVFGGILQPAQIIQEMENETPIRLGSPLFSKLKKEYWKLPHVVGRPLVLAIQDFHKNGALMSSSAPLSRYLYGLGQRWWHDDAGNLVIESHQIHQHNLGTKEIPSGFFRQPNSENISAVLFCNSGTIPKFNRMGHQGKYRKDGVRMLRWGTCYRHDPNATLPRPFVYEVGDKQFGLETWPEGTVLIRNPHALYPLPRGWFGAAVEEDLVDGQIITTFAQRFLPYMSITNILEGASKRQVRAMADKHFAALLKQFPA